MKSRAIVFVGMDGSGKTTLSRALGKDLRSKGKKVHCIWVLENEQSLFRRLIRRAAPLNPTRFRRPGTPSGMNEVSPGFVSGMFSKIYPVAVIFDYFLYGLFRLRLPFTFGRRQVWIFDRFFFDVILSLSEEFSLGGYARALLWFALGIAFPTPDLILFIDVVPETALSRKPDAYPSREAAVMMRQQYIGLEETLEHQYGSRVLHIDNNHGMGESDGRIRKGVLIALG